MILQDLTPRQVDMEELRAEVSDSLFIRRGLIRKVRAEEMTLAEAKQEIRRRQDYGKSLGLETRKEYWNR
tara:strand:+ start:5490 stop:5699 length:210 start_codon:yes stop_codon:yes gene_type:complete